MKTHLSFPWDLPLTAGTGPFRFRLDHQFVYVPGAVTLAMAFPLWQKNGPILGCVMGLLGLGSLLCCRWLLARIDRMSSQKSFLDEGLRQSQKLAAIGELSAGIAHEINNPLAIIGHEADWARHVLGEMKQQGVNLPEDFQESLDEIRRQVARCGEITHGLLDFARKKDPLVQEGDINGLVEDMVRLVEREATPRKIRLVRDYFRELPRIPTDHPLLKQVILNLLTNATHAVDREGTITVRTLAAGHGHVDIVVEDTGCGIHKEDMDRIFDPFFTTKPPGKGTGLGLFICHGIVERLGGRIHVESELGKGTKFTVRLPLNHSRGERRP